MITEQMEEFQRLKSENHSLLKEKAKAISDWHNEVRETLRMQGLDIAGIKSSIASASLISSVVDKLESRVKSLEIFQTKSIAYISGACAVSIITWALINKFL